MQRPFGVTRCAAGSLDHEGYELKDSTPGIDLIQLADGATRIIATTSRHVGIQGLLEDVNGIDKIVGFCHKDVTFIAVGCE